MFIFNVAKVSKNEVNICTSNPCDQKAPASDCSECSVSNVHLYFQPELTSACGRANIMTFFHCFGGSHAEP